jgi:hypothetical protein
MVGDPHSFCSIRSLFHGDLGEFENFLHSLGFSYLQIQVHLLQLLSRFYSLVTALQHLQHEAALLEGDDPLKGVAISLASCDKVFITPDTFSISRPWESLRVTDGLTPLQLLENIRQTKARLAGKHAKTDDDVVDRFFQLLHSVTIDDRFDPASYEQVRSIILSPGGRRECSDYASLYAALCFHRFPAFAPKGRKRTIEDKTFTTGELRDAIKDLLPGSPPPRVEHPPPRIETYVGSTAPPPPRTETYVGSTAPLRIRVGQVGLKNLDRIIAHGVLGDGVVNTPWIFNPARLNTTVNNRRVNDGKCGLDCLCSVQHPDHSKVTVTTGTQFRKDNNVARDAPMPPVPFNVIFWHWKCWCRWIHMKVNDYVRDHPSEDCAWMVEAYTPEEWAALCATYDVRLYTPPPRQ